MNGYIIRLYFCPQIKMFSNLTITYFGSKKVNEVIILWVPL